MGQLQRREIEHVHGDGWTDPNSFHENRSRISPNEAHRFIVDPQGKERVAEQVLVHIEHKTADRRARNEHRHAENARNNQ